MIKNENEKLKIGRISYLNLYPVFYGLEKTLRDKGRYLFFDGYPALVNAELRSGGVDASPSSSIVYLKNPEDFSLIEGHSISADGPIRSIYLFSRHPIEKLGGRTIGVTNQTETSAALLQITLKKFYGLDFEPRVTALSPARSVGRFGACLAIGDDAMRARKKFGEGAGGGGRLLVYDLGEIWREKTGLPFVFALWIARKDQMTRKKRAFEQFRRDLDRAKAYALSHFGEAARRQPVKELGEREVIEYWKGISYGLGAPEKKGLRLFRKYAAELGLLG